MKKMLIVAAAAAATLAAPMAHAQKVGLAMAELDTFLTILKNGTVDAGKKAGATVQVEDAQGDVGKQLSQIQNLIAQKVDAIIVNPVDTDATPKITKMVTDAKIPLVYVNRKPVDFAKLPAGVAFVASDEKVSGTVQTQEVCRLLKGKGNVLVLMGELSNEAARTRTQDIEDVVATKECSGIKIADKREGKWSRTNGQDIMTNWLSSGVKFDAVIANNDEMAIGAINALKAAKKWTPASIVAGIDATPDALASMKAGDLKVTVFQNAAGQGSGAVETALKLIKKQPVDRFVNVPFELVTPANLAKYSGKN
ncbi:periplasmic binding protein/LacI transcriptional regulator [Leptothrix cholodnii SP-6]|uniref:Periplasmic binding protein/LacI transcriptional regulator n=1 Tax=Leptothrix cholodnii (strain ATCC 51168 / LMG 8142 / SP-6) TaxID=395495 RepID=B1Y2B8_LEPCP|nr:sugar ABC transporter substrate-binding protein [Leptothrix cholodnii]ACB35571.1 periplasmic binding protein/LacI transcriptional regulator [Leptothrix cholodnii SP-6]